MALPKNHATKTIQDNSNIIHSGDCDGDKEDIAKSRPIHGDFSKLSPDEQEMITGIPKEEKEKEYDGIHRTQTKTKKSKTPISTNQGKVDTVDGDKNDWMFILGHDQLKKKIVIAGEKGIKPNQGDVVDIFMTIYNESTGEKIHPKHRVTFILGDGDVINALDLAVSLMEKNELSKIFTVSKYAYGENGWLDIISPNQDILLEVYLEKFVSAFNFVNKSPIIDIFTQIEQKRSIGNIHYSHDEIDKCINTYNKAIELMTVLDKRPREDFGKVMNHDIKESKIKLFNNLALCNHKVRKFDSAIRACDGVLKVDTKNLKAIFRKGKCLADNGELKDAITFLKKYSKLQPKSRMIQNEIKKYDEEYREHITKSRQIYAKMMNESTPPQIPQRSAPSSNIWKFMGMTIVPVIGLTLALYMKFH